MNRTATNCQPCDTFIPGNKHDCYGGCPFGTVETCQSCGKDHHSDGWQTCPKRGQRKHCKHPACVAVEKEASVEKPNDARVTAAHDAEWAEGLASMRKGEAALRAECDTVTRERDAARAEAVTERESAAALGRGIVELKDRAASDARDLKGILEERDSALARAEHFSGCADRAEAALKKEQLRGAPHREAVSAERERLEAAIECLKRELRDTGAECDRLRAANSDVRADLGVTKVERDAANGKVRDLSGQVVTLMHERDAAKAKLAKEAQIGANAWKEENTARLVAEDERDTARQAHADVRHALEDERRVRRVAEHAAEVAEKRVADVEEERKDLEYDVFAALGVDGEHGHYAPDMVRGVVKERDEAKANLQQARSARDEWREIAQEAKQALKAEQGNAEQLRCDLRSQKEEMDQGFARFATEAEHLRQRVAEMNEAAGRLPDLIAEATADLRGQIAAEKARASRFAGWLDATIENRDAILSAADLCRTEHATGDYDGEHGETYRAGLDIMWGAIVRASGLGSVVGLPTAPPPAETVKMPSCPSDDGAPCEYVIGDDDAEGTAPYCAKCRLGRPAPLPDAGAHEPTFDPRYPTGLHSGFPWAKGHTPRRAGELGATSQALRDAGRPPLPITELAERVTTLTSAVLDLARLVVIQTDTAKDMARIQGLHCDGIRLDAAAIVAKLGGGK